MPDRGTAGDKPEEHGPERPAEKPEARDTWVDPRSWLSPEDRLKYYRRHEPMSEQELVRLEAGRADQDDDLDSYTSDRGKDSNRYTFDRDEDFGRVEEVGQREDADRDEAVARDEGTTGAALPSGADRDQVRDRGDESVGEPDGAGGAEGGGGPPGAQASGSPDFDGERDEETAGECETGGEFTLAEGQEGDAEPSEASGHVVQSSDEQDDRLGEWSGVTVTVEDGKVRVHDPLRPDVWNPERGEVKDQSDRLGDRIVNEENDRRSRFDRLREKTRQHGEDILEGVSKSSERLEDIARPSPTGQVADSRVSLYASDQPPAGGVGDIVVSVMAATMLFYGAGRAGWNYYRRIREREQSDAGDG